MHAIGIDIGGTKIAGALVTEAGEILYVDDPVGIEAKFHISRLLDVPINSVERFTALTSPE